MNANQTQNNSLSPQPISTPLVGIIGGGVAGATTALHLSEQGYNVVLVEKNESLVSGPPICHLHAGGNLYREISDQQCIELLRDSIESVKLYPHTINRRPTVIATPKHDQHDPQSLLPRLQQVQQHYRQLIDLDPSNKVLGEPEDYFTVYTKQQLLALKEQQQPERPTTIEQWLIPFAQHVDLDSLRYPVIIVQEYGWSVFRLSAQAELALNIEPKCQLQLSSKVTHIEFTPHQKKPWAISIDSNGQTQQLHVDYLVNACGFRSGSLDNLANIKRTRLVEFKAAYVANWVDNDLQWPEVIFHGQRGTPQGMAQLTPYGKHVYQLHGMTEDITLFKHGLVISGNDSQPQLPTSLLNKIDKGWSEEVIARRTQSAINHIAQYIPSFTSASLGGKPLYGAQQIPGDDVSLRATSVWFGEQNYACIETVKASSCLPAAIKIEQQLKLSGLEPSQRSGAAEGPLNKALTESDIEQYAVKLAKRRGYPEALALYYGQ
ncbi:FAD-dependent oxidoreductase [Vibrio sp. qd031]|uniref:FAD-dependent oxidoreductase n=1 Tax=Vibrio sp. qd031 TaxID=1603038 RepID=UPI000A11198E|nr:FAD-dependent oxidoreductase [Vibrio sp. qd031]